MPAENACHAYFVLNNGTGEPLQELQTDVYLFDGEGVILRGVALQFTDIPADRSTVVPFELTDLDCGNIARVLLNKVLVCTGANGAPIDGCADRLAVSTRSPVAFEF
jgi:hypothetical protein